MENSHSISRVIDIDALMEVVGVIADSSYDYYIHAGAALYMQLGTGELDDVDVRINCEFKEVQKLLKESELFSEFKDFRINYNHEFSNVKFLTPYIDFDYRGVHFDVSCDMVSEISGFGELYFPMTNEWFESANIIEIETGLKSLRVADMNMLFLYYVMYDRNPFENKDDQAKVTKLVASGFDLDEFMGFLSEHYRQSFVDRVNDYLKKYDGADLNIEI